jgi:hypothetical protein
MSKKIRTMFFILVAVASVLALLHVIVNGLDLVEIAKRIHGG